jgi:hypothetical protein
LILRFPFLLYLSYAAASLPSTSTGELDLVSPKQHRSLHLFHCIYRRAWLLLFVTKPSPLKVSFSTVFELFRRAENRIYNNHHHVCSQLRSLNVFLPKLICFFCFSLKNHEIFIYIIQSCAFNVKSPHAARHGGL